MGWSASMDLLLLWWATSQVGDLPVVVVEKPSELVQGFGRGRVVVTTDDPARGGDQGHHLHGMDVQPQQLRLDSFDPHKSALGREVGADLAELVGEPVVVLSKAVE